MVEHAPSMCEAPKANPRSWKEENRFTVTHSLGPRLGGHILDKFLGGLGRHLYIIILKPRLENVKYIRKVESKSKY